MPGGALDRFRASQGQTGGGGYSAPSIGDSTGFEEKPRIDYDALDAPEPTQFNTAYGGGEISNYAGPAVAIGGGALALLAGLGLKRYGLAGAAKGAAKTVSNLRMASMLSGMAAPKSVLGNMGAAANVAMEQGNLGALKQFFSRQTARDWVNEFKNPNALAGSTVPGSSKWNPFGRIMGAGDVATRQALERAGLPAAEAERQVLQSPLPERVGHALDNLIAEHAIPFRRTPINQAIEGGTTVTDAFKGSRVTRDYGAQGSYEARTRLPLAVHTAGGAITGAATADEQYPITPGAYAAFAGRYGAPALVGALLGRIAAGGNADSSLIGSAMPVAEYGVTQALDPRTALAPLDPSQSALARFMRRLSGEK